MGFSWISGCSEKQGRLGRSCFGCTCFERRPPFARPSAARAREQCAQQDSHRAAAMLQAGPWLREPAAPAPPGPALLNIDLNKM